MLSSITDRWCVRAWARGRSFSNSSGVVEDGRKRLALSITAWFCVPEQGMDEFEYLCRASAFLVKTGPYLQNRSGNGDDSFPHKYHVVTVSHAVAPWRWPQLYPQEWLHFVNERHTHYTLELRDERGVYQTQWDLLPRCYHHQPGVGRSRDLAVLHMSPSQEEAMQKVLHSLDVEDSLQLLLPYAKEDLREDLHLGQELRFHGHDVTVNADDSNGLQESSSTIAIPLIASGVLQGRTAEQTFVRTLPDIVLPNGMCGGPVVMSSSAATFNSQLSHVIDRRRGVGNNSPKRRAVSVNTVAEHNAASRAAAMRKIEHGDEDNASNAIVCGMLEGIVPLEHPQEELRGAAVFVEAPCIHRFLQDVTNGAVDGIKGGEAALHVHDEGQKKGPVDWNSFFNQ